MKLKNIGAALKDTKTRTILIVVGIIVLIGLGIGYLGLKRAERAAVPGGASLQEVPSIKSIPGVGVPSREYVKTQEQENILRAEQAAREGTSALPTITRTTYVGPSGFEVPGIPTAAPGSPECSPEALARARAAGVKAEELRCKGCSADQLRAAGYTAGDLLNAGFSADQLKAAGYSATDLRDAGYTAAEMARAGYAPIDLVTAGFSPSELNQAGIGAGQLTAAGITAQQLAKAGIGVAPSSALPKDCSVEALKKARAQGVSAADLRKMGCSAAALRAAGYTAKELKDAGFSAKELKDAGFSAQELKDAGFTAGELRAAGFSAKDLKDAGFSAADLREAGFGADELANAGFTADDLRAAGFSDGELVRAGLAVAPIAAAVPSITPAAPTAAAAPVTAPAAPPQPAIDASIAALEKLQQRQAEQLSLQERQDRVTQMVQTMNQQASDLFATWAPPAKQQYQQGEPEAAGAAVATAGVRLASAQGGQALAAQQSLIKAGSIMFAVLDTSVNSDEPSPIMATVVSGPYKGSKLVGQFQRVDKKVVVNFTAMNVPSLVQSVPINAVAIDPNTARTALASDVDNHYLLRYGSLFASAFVSGYAKATEQSGSTTNITTAGVSETGPNLSATDKALVGLGQIGNQFSATLGSIFTRPPTVKVNSGEGIGILFMADAPLTATPITATTQTYSSPLTQPNVSTGPAPVPNPPSGAAGFVAVPTTSAATAAPAVSATATATTSPAGAGGTTATPSTQQVLTQSVTSGVGQAVTSAVPSS